MTYLITTTDPQRRQLWRHLFGKAALPVLAPRPRWQWLAGRPNEVLAYDLDVNALPAGAVSRLAAYVARRAGWPYEYAKAAVQGGWAVTAVNCRLVEEKPVEKSSTLPVLDDRHASHTQRWMRPQ
jgi:hypothetical protein